jgi:UDP-N-acetylglucosamine 2-epimerase (non-hydrolysing)
MSIAIVQGTRPEIIKNYPIIKALREEKISFQVFHTNQHSQELMRDNIYRDMGYQADHMLAMPYQLGRAIEWLQSGYKKNNIQHVIVNGDTAASLAGALAALYMDIDVSHVEAGLRSRDPLMLEERNRIMVDNVANLLFPYTYYEYDLLIASPDVRGQVLVEGNTTVDVIHNFQHKLHEKPMAGDYLYVTLHRRELTRSRAHMQCVVDTLNAISTNICDVVFPLHPRTADALANFKLKEELSSSIHLIEPLPPIESLCYEKHASAILTDSGCIQEEAYILKVPCITFRDNTERYLTLRYGANQLSGIDQAHAIALVTSVLGKQVRSCPAIYGERGAGARIISRISEYMTQGFVRVTEPQFQALQW